MGAPLAAATTIAVCVIVIGCGGGGDGKSGTAAAELPTITAPTTPATQSAPGASDNPSSTTEKPSSDADAGSGARLLQAMAPFYDCLRGHGVQPSPLAGTSLRGDQLRDPQLVHKEIGAKVACLPELPKQLRAAGRRLKQRLQQLQR